MLARIRKAQEEREGGFTLIELLVVMIIIGILAAIAIPIFLNQRKKAQDSAAKADVSTIGKEVATYFVDQAGVPTVSIVAGRYYLTDASGYGKTTASPNGADLGKASNNVVLLAPASTTPAVAVDGTHWCFAVNNPQGDVQKFKYSAQNGLEAGTCTDPSGP
jgi:type IV pilus assembly protein PilA